MADPIVFRSTSPNFALPLLFTGQAQKEFVLNQSTLAIDALLQRGIEASQETPPAQAQDGECYRVTAQATGEWQGHEDAIAIRISGAWNYAPPAHGMAVFDRGQQQLLIFKSSWQAAATPTALQGGNVIDVEARAMLSELAEALKTYGLLPELD
ncbi:MAG: DUF2793 domain-containing protein [Erythrobacter sp.]